jgi:hypothetical protein
MAIQVERVLGKVDLQEMFRVLRPGGLGLMQNYQAEKS